MLVRGYSVVREKVPGSFSLAMRCGPEGQAHLIRTGGKGSRFIFFGVEMRVGGLSGDAFGTRSDGAEACFSSNCSGDLTAVYEQRIDAAMVHR